MCNAAQGPSLPGLGLPTGTGEGLGQSRPIPFRSVTRTPPESVSKPLTHGWFLKGVPYPAASAAPRRLLEMQILGSTLTSYTCSFRGGIGQSVLTRLPADANAHLRLGVMVTDLWRLMLIPQ